MTQTASVTQPRSFAVQNDHQSKNKKNCYITEIYRLHSQWLRQLQWLQYLSSFPKMRTKWRETSRSFTPRGDFQKLQRGARRCLRHCPIKPLTPTQEQREGTTLAFLQRVRTRLFQESLHRATSWHYDRLIANREHPPNSWRNYHKSLLLFLSRAGYSVGRVCWAGSTGWTWSIRLSVSTASLLIHAPPPPSYRRARKCRDKFSRINSPFVEPSPPLLVKSRDYWRRHCVRHAPAKWHACARMTLGVGFCEADFLFLCERVNFRWNVLRKKGLEILI